MLNNTFEKLRRHLDKMPFDKRFDVDGNSELCHATGYEVFDGEDWWNEFIINFKPGNPIPLGTPLKNYFYTHYIVD